MLNLGVIGAGRIGRVHCSAIAGHIPNARVKAVADIGLNDEIRDWARAQGIPMVYTGYQDILKDGEIDAVLICSSTDTHSEISIEAARAKKHIFCEKPVDHDIRRIYDVMDEAEKNNVKFQTGFNRRFDHNFKALKMADTGSPYIIKITSRDPAPPPPNYIEHSGGMFLDMSIHDFDMARYLSGSEAESVYAEGGVLIDPAIGEAGDIDTAVIQLRMKNGAIVVIDNSRRAAYGYDQRAEVFGPLGCAAVSNDTGSTLKISRADGIFGEKPLYFFLERYMQSFADEIKAFIQAVADDTDTPVTIHDGLAAVVIALAAKKSLMENRPVRISEIEVSRNQ